MKSYLILLVVMLVSYKCSGGILKGLLSDALEVNSKVHNAAGAFLGEVAQAIRGNHRHTSNGGQNQGKPGDTVVVIVEEGPDRPPYNNPGYGGGGPPNQNGYGSPGNNYNNHPQHNHGHHHNPYQHGHGQQYGYQNPNNNNQNGYGNPNGNWNPNNQYGNQNNQPGNPDYKPNNNYGNHNSQYGKPNNQNEYANHNQHEHNNGYPNQPTLENTNQDRPIYQEQTTENNTPIYSNTNKPHTGTNTGYNSQKPTEDGHKTDQHIINKQEKTTMKPGEDSDLPLFVPLGPNDYVYGGDKIDVNAPKRETGNSKPKPNEDTDEDFGLDIRIGE